MKHWKYLNFNVGKVFIHSPLPVEGGESSGHVSSRCLSEIGRITLLSRKKKKKYVERDVGKWSTCVISPVEGIFNAAE